MSRLIGLALAIALACPSMPAAAAPAPAPALTVVTFNLLHGGATSGLTGQDHYGVLGEMVIVPRSQSARP